MAPTYPTMHRLSQATPEQLWEWYARLPPPRTPRERKVLVETMRRLNLIPTRSAAEDGGSGGERDNLID